MAVAPGATLCVRPWRPAVLRTMQVFDRMGESGMATSGQIVNPAMRRVLEERELALRAGHRPEVVEMIAGRRGDRMVAVRQHDDVAVAYRVRDRLALGDVEHLVAEALLRAHTKVIDL